MNRLLNSRGQHLSATAAAYDCLDHQQEEKMSPSYMKMSGQHVCNLVL